MAEQSNSILTKVQDDQNRKEIILTIKDWLNYFKSKWIVILLLVFLGGSIGFIYSYSQKKLYIASLTFALEEDKSGGGGGLSGLASQFGLDLGSNAGGAFSGGNLYELMKSRTLVEKTLLRPIRINNKELSYAEYYIQFNKLRDKWKGSKLSEIQFLPNIEINSLSVEQNEILGAMSGNIISKMLSISQIRGASITIVEIISLNELFSKAFLEALIREVSLFYIETKSKKARINVGILEKQIDSIRNELNASMSEVASANDNIYNLNPTLSIKRVSSTRRQIDVQANSLMLSQFLQNLALAKISLQKETPLIQIIDLPSFPLAETKFNKLMSIIIGGFLGLVFSILILTGIKLSIKTINLFRMY